MKKKVIWKAGLLLLMIVLVSIAGYDYTIKKNDEEPAETMVEENALNFEYDILPEDTVVIRKYFGDETLVFIPERLDGKVVSAIGESAFQGNVGVEQIVLPQGIEVIEDQAFKDCSALQYVVMGTEIVSIGEDAFSYCPNLKELRLPEGMTGIDVCICAYCPSLEKVVIPHSMERISPSAFMECDKLYLIYGSNPCAEDYAQTNGLVYVDLERIKEEGGMVW